MELFTDSTQTEGEIQLREKALWLTKKTGPTLPLEVLWEVIKRFKIKL
jgi:hypothetical protein